jgi:hypothetical protein
VVSGGTEAGVVTLVIGDATAEFGENGNGEGDNEELGELDDVVAADVTGTGWGGRWIWLGGRGMGRGPWDGLPFTGRG